MESENTRPTSQHSNGHSRYGASNWGVTFGLMAAVLIGGILYFSFSGDLIDARSTAVPTPPTASTPVYPGAAPSTQPSVPSTK